LKEVEMRKYWLLAGALLALGAAIVALPAGAESKDEPASQRERERLAALTTCLRERADLPGFNADAGGVATALPPAAADRALREAAEECGLPAPPTRADFAEQRVQMEARRARLGDKLAQCAPRVRLPPRHRP
jgi:hypothetical protein